VSLIYEELPGWTEDITGVKSLSELPENARHYVERSFSADRHSAFHFLSRS
jgi:adenylosuccinate synthase